MSDNTCILITWRQDGLFDVKRLDLDGDSAIYQEIGLESLDQALDVAEALPTAEYGIQITRAEYGIEITRRAHEPLGE